MTIPPGYELGIMSIFLLVLVLVATVIVFKFSDDNSTNSRKEK